MWIEQLVAESTGKEGQGNPAGRGRAARRARRLRRATGFSSASPGRRTATGGRRRAVAARDADGHPVARIDDARDALDLGARDVPLGVRDRRRGPSPRHQSVRPAERPGGEGPHERDPRGTGGGAPPARPGSTRRRSPSCSPRSGPATISRSRPTCPRPRENEAALQAMRIRVRDAKRVATTVGFGPRFLHSTGQLHKGGPPTGVFLQITRRAARRTSRSRETVGLRARSSRRRRRAISPRSSRGVAASLARSAVQGRGRRTRRTLARAVEADRSVAR